MVGRRVRIIDEEVEGVIVSKGGGSRDWRFLIEDDKGRFHSASHYAIEAIDARGDATNPSGTMAMLKSLRETCMEHLAIWDRGGSTRKSLEKMRAKCQAASNFIRNSG